MRMVEALYRCIDGRGVYGVHLGWEEGDGTAVVFTFELDEGDAKSFWAALRQCRWSEWPRSCGRWQNENCPCMSIEEWYCT